MVMLHQVVYVTFHIGMLGNEENDLLKQVNPLLISLFEAVVVLDDYNDRASCAISHGTFLGRKSSLLLLQWIKCEALSSHLDLEHLLTRCILYQVVFVFKMYFNN